MIRILSMSYQWFEIDKRAAIYYCTKEPFRVDTGKSVALAWYKLRRYSVVFNVDSSCVVIRI